MDNIAQKVIKIIRKLSLQVKELDDAQLLAIDYLDKALIDSLQIIEMITQLEEDFKIKFLPEQLESDKFRTLKGVSEIIEERLKK